jgi:hypothetical protein
MCNTFHFQAIDQKSATAQNFVQMTKYLRE